MQWLFRDSFSGAESAAGWLVGLRDGLFGSEALHGYEMSYLRAFGISIIPLVVAFGIFHTVESNDIALFYVFDDVPPSDVDSGAYAILGLGGEDDSGDSSDISSVDDSEDGSEDGTW